MRNPFASFARLHYLAAITVSAALATAQSQMVTRGEVVAELNNSTVGLPTGVVFGGTTAFDFPVMSRDGNILFRGQLTGTGVTATNDRGLFLGRTQADLALLVRAGDLDPSGSGTLTNSRMMRVLSTTGVGVDSDVFSTPRISPLGNRVLFHTQLYDGGNPGLDGLIHTTAAGLVNDNFIYTGTPGALQILAQQGMVMPGGATLSFLSVLITQQATALNSAGTAIFKSNLLGGDVSGTTNNNAWIRGTPGNLGYFLRKGDLALGGTVGIGTVGANCVLNEAGDVLHDEVLSTTLGSTPATSADDGIIFITPFNTGVHTPLMREGDPVPDVTGTPIAGVLYGTYFLSGGFGAGGTAAFISTMTGAVTPADDRAVFAGGLGTVRMLVRKGDFLPIGEQINVFNNTTSYAENQGVLFGCTLVSPGIGNVNVNNDSVLVLARTSGPTVIAREGDPCPGLPAGYVFGIATGTFNFGPSGAHRLNERGQVLFYTLANNGGPNVAVLYSWDPLHGLRLQQAAGDNMGTGTVTSPPIPVTHPSGDGNQLGFTAHGDFCGRTTLAVGHNIVRGHVGTLFGSPSAVPVTGGVPHNITLDLTPAYGNQWYVILATALGTSNGFPHPLNAGILVPIDFDAVWTNGSLAAANTALYTNSLYVTNAAGQNLLPISFNFPPGFPSYLGTTLKHSALLFDNSLVGTYATEPATVYLY